MITSLERADFERYRRVWVLNPLSGVPRQEGVGDLRADDEAERYQLMLSNVPRPEGVEPIFATDHIDLFELSAPPPAWEFAADGRWMSYANPHDPI